MAASLQPSPPPAQGKKKKRANKAKRKRELKEAVLAAEVAPMAPSHASSPPSSPVILTASHAPSVLASIRFDHDESNGPSPSSPPPIKRQRMAGPSSRCPYCLEALPSNFGPIGFCPHSACALRVDLPFESPQNAHIISSRAKGQSSTTTPTPAPRNELTVREKEFDRLASLGPAYDRFDNPSSCSVTTAHNLLLGAFHSAEYEAAPEQLRTLIQRGKLTNPGDAIPRRTDSIDAAGKDVVASLSFNADGSQGRLSQTSTKVIMVNDMTDYLRALVGAIIPSLIQQPLPLMDWCTMTLTLIELQTLHGWETAKQYLHQTLARSVQQRVPFGKQNIEILQDILITNAFSATVQRLSGRLAPASLPNPNPSITNRPRLDTRGPLRPCFDWNIKVCVRAPCPYPHTCMLIPKGTCTNSTSPNHKASACSGFKHAGTVALASSSEKKAKRTVKKATSGEDSE